MEFPMQTAEVSIARGNRKEGVGKITRPTEIKYEADVPDAPQRHSLLENAMIPPY